MICSKISHGNGEVQIPSEPVYGNEAWNVLAAEEHPEAPAPKRARRERYTSLKISRVRDVSVKSVWERLPQLMV